MEKLCVLVQINESQNAWGATRNRHSHFHQIETILVTTAPNVSHCVRYKIKDDLLFSLSPPSVDLSTSLDLSTSPHYVIPFFHLLFFNRAKTTRLSLFSSAVSDLSREKRSPEAPSLISLVVSVDVKHHDY